MYVLPSPLPWVTVVGPIIAQDIAGVFTFHVFGYLVFGVFIWYLVGALPGMNRAIAIALLIPFTFGMSPLKVQSIVLKPYMRNIHFGPSNIDAAIAKHKRVFSDILQAIK
jgi:TctA family transporter